MAQWRWKKGLFWGGCVWTANGGIATMFAMAKDAGLKIYFRTTPKLRGFYNRLTGALRATDAISSKKGYTSNDAIINALLLWAADRDPEDLARDLGAYIEHFEAVWDEVLATGPEPRPPESVASAATEVESQPGDLRGQGGGPASGGSDWVTAGVRHRTDGDNARATRKNRQTREESRAKSSKEGSVEPAPLKRKRGRKGELPPSP